MDGQRYVDVTVTHAKAAPDGICVVIEAHSKGPDAALQLVPQLWFRNTWAWGRDDRRGVPLSVHAAHRPGARAGGPAYDEVVTTFLERFLDIAYTMESREADAVALWDEEDGFFYDALVRPDGQVEPGDVIVLSLVDAQHMSRLLTRMLDEAEFLSPHGIRSLSAAYRDGCTACVSDQEMTTRYLPGESDSGLFGGGSAWRGPVWFPLDVLLVDALADKA